MVKECEAKRIILVSCSPEITHPHVVSITSVPTNKHLSPDSATWESLLTFLLQHGIDLADPARKYCPDYL